MKGLFRKTLCIILAVLMILSTLFQMGKVTFAEDAEPTEMTEEAVKEEPEPSVPEENSGKTQEVVWPAESPAEEAPKEEIKPEEETKPEEEAKSEESKPEESNPESEEKPEPEDKPEPEEKLEPEDKLAEESKQEEEKTQVKRELPALSLGTEKGKESPDTASDTNETAEEDKKDEDDNAKGTKAAPTGSVKLGGSATVYLTLQNTTFRFFHTDKITLTAEDDEFEYRVIVDDVVCQEGGSYHWDGTKYTESDDESFSITDRDDHKKYEILYKVQYKDPDDNEWKYVENVEWKTTVIVAGDAEKDWITGDEAYVENIKLNMVTSGTAKFDDNDLPGNDSSATNDIVRSFDTVKYDVTFNTRTVNEYNTYKHAYLWVEIDLPCTRDIASIDTTVFSTDVRQAKAPYEIEKDGTTHTIYTFYYEKRTTIEDDGTVNHAIPQLGHFPFSMKVYGAKNGTHIKPVVGMAVAQLEVDANGNPKKDKKGYYVVARDYSDFEGAYDIPKYAEGPDVQVSAKPGFNVDINPSDVYQQAASKVYDFSTGNDKALDKDAGRVFGRAVKFGINVSMRNEDVSKGLKGLELPDGNPITFELDFQASFEGQAIDSPLI